MHSLPFRHTTGLTLPDNSFSEGQHERLLFVVHGTDRICETELTEGEEEVLMRTNHGHKSTVNLHEREKATEIPAHPIKSH